MGSNRRTTTQSKLITFGICGSLYRKRKDDIIEFVDYFLNKFKAKYHKTHLKINDEAFKVLKSHNWPGNVRELENFIRRPTMSGAEWFVVGGIIIAAADQILDRSPWKSNNILQLLLEGLKTIFRVKG